MTRRCRRREGAKRMLWAIRGLALAGLAVVALAAWIAYAHVVDVSAQGDIVSYLPRFAFTTGTLLSFAAGMLTLALTIPRRQRPWSAALLAGLILNAYWSPMFYDLWWMLFPTSSDGMLMSSSLSVVVMDVISTGLAPVAPALLALGYTV